MLAFDEPLFKHGSLVLGLIVFIHLCRWVLTYQAKRVADAWIKEIVEDKSGEDEQTRNEGATELKLRLMAQLRELNKRIKHHLDVTIFFYTRYYMAITLFSIVGGIAAIALIFIIRSGWNEVNPYVITVFLIMSGHAAFYGSFPKIFQQEKNIADNKNLYLQFSALRNELESYLASGENKAGEKTTEGSFIHHIDLQLEKLNNFAIGFDYTKTPIYTDTFEIPKISK